VDNLVRGRKEFVPSQVRFELMDVSDPEPTKILFSQLGRDHDISTVWHLAANSDIPAGVADPNVDLKDTFLTTHSILLAMRDTGLKRLAFASSSAIYGEHPQPFHEDFGPLRPISNYGAMKLAAEAAISAALGQTLSQAFIFRFPNVVGTPATHGVILDFIKRLRAEPAKLTVLGNGKQCKGYMHVSELVDAMLFITEHSTDAWSCFNIGPNDQGATVEFIAEEVVRLTSPSAKIEYGTADRGWPGDVPRFQYNTVRLARLGWQPRLTSEQAVTRAVEQVLEQERNRSC